MGARNVEFGRGDEAGSSHVLREATHAADLAASPIVGPIRCVRLQLRRMRARRLRFAARFVGDPVQLDLLLAKRANVRIVRQEFGAVFGVVKHVLDRLAVVDHAVDERDHLGSIHAVSLDRFDLLVNNFLPLHVDLPFLCSALRFGMHIVQRGTSSDLILLYLVGTHLDDALKQILGPEPWIVSFGDSRGEPPKAVAGALGISVRSLVLAGYSGGCQSVRAVLRAPSMLPPHERLGVVAIDGTHANIPPEKWQIEVWSKLGWEARRGEKLFVATCTNNIYTAKLPDPYMPTLAVLRMAVEPALFPASPPHEIHERDLHVYASMSKEIDKEAHIAQQRDVLPEMLRKHVAPWLGYEATTEPTPKIKTPLDVALSLVGQREIGPNRGEIVRRSLAGCVRGGKPLGIREGVAWCAGFVGLCDHEAGAKYPWRAAVRELVEDARASGRWYEVDDYVPKPGDLAIFRRGAKDPRRGEEGHVERVAVAPDATGSLTTIGGNVGDAIVRRTWRIGQEEIGHELVGWIARGPIDDLRKEVDGAVFLSLDKLARDIEGA